ncbi:MAG: cytochrome c family protein [Candidatus Delongbacteria bacterium]|nr:cytochrome c family protein [Candidatus Delongbacteria bacterium]
MKKGKIILSMALLLTFSSGLIAADYIGGQKCKMCHKKEEKGAQYTKWEATAHAHSLETLHNEQSAAIVAELGLAQAAWEAPECLSCHVTGWGKGGYVLGELTDPKDVKRNEGLASVSCEACHQAGSEYKSTKVMQGILAGEIEEASVGMLWHPDEATCLQCHNEQSPTHKPFAFAERVVEVSHPYPPTAGE